jgi:hypothetical protein
MSNPSDPLVIIVEAKQQPGKPYAGWQLTRSIELLRGAGFRRVLVFSGSEAEFMSLLKFMQFDEFIRSLNKP